MNGKMICAMGIPASGKSSVLKELSKLFEEETVSFFAFSGYSFVFLRHSYFVRVSGGRACEAI